MKFCVINLGCKINRVESDDYVRFLVDAGARNGTEDEADLIIVNTCTVTAEADKKSRKAIHKALRANDYAQVVVTGCASAIYPDEFTGMDSRICVVPKCEMVDFLKGTLANDGQSIPSDKADNLVPRTDRPNNSASSNSSDSTKNTPYYLRQHGRVGVKIQDGCDNACTYCIVHVARGKSTSRNAHDVISHCLDLADAGVREIILCGINLGAYSFDGIDLAQLLQMLLDATQDIHDSDEYPTRFRLSSIEPMNINDNVISVIAQSDGRICKHLHLPLQSGSNNILQHMDRPYRVAEFLHVVHRLRSSMPTLALTTDIIVGFPGETENDFNNTCEAAELCGFSKIHVFPYSSRKGTPAAQFDDHVPPEIKHERAARIRSISDQLRRADFETRKGTNELAFVIDDERALTESYFEIKPPEGALRGSLVSCKLL